MRKHILRLAVLGACAAVLAVAAGLVPAPARAVDAQEHAAVAGAEPPAAAPPDTTEPPAAPRASEKDNSCIACHTEIGEDLLPPIADWRKSVHAEAGVLCQSCHGGDATSMDYDQAKAPATGFIGRPSPVQIVEKCGSCHSDAAEMRQYGIRTDQLALYKTSHHGKAVLEEGSTDAATCVSCHGNHAIRKPDDPQSSVNRFNVPGTCAKCHADKELMDKVGLPHDALEEYKASYHGTLLFKEKSNLVPTCATCHGVHGATPPEVEEVAHVCGQCHGNTAENYARGPHEAARTFMGIPRCIDCHDNHKILFPSAKMFSPKEGVCVTCHEGGKGAETAAGLGRILGDAQGAYDAALARIASASGRYIYLDPIEERLREAHSKLHEAIPVAHALNVDEVKTYTDEVIAISGEVTKSIDSKEADLLRRRKAWYVVAAVAALWAFLVIWKLKQIPNPYATS